MVLQKNILTAALVGAFVGVLIGAGTSQIAQLVAFQGANPNAAKYSEPVKHYTDGLYRNKRSFNYGTGDLYRPLEGGEESDVADPHAAAPAEIPAHCRGLSRTRLTRCVAEYAEGVIYQNSEIRR